MKDDKYEDIAGGAYKLWFLVPLLAIYDLVSILFKIGTEESRDRKISKLKSNFVALFLYFLLLIFVVWVIMENI